MLPRRKIRWLALCSWAEDTFSLERKSDIHNEVILVLIVVIENYSTDIQHSYTTLDSRLEKRFLIVMLSALIEPFISISLFCLKLEKTRLIYTNHSETMILFIVAN